MMRFVPFPVASFYGRPHSGLLQSIYCSFSYIRIIHIYNAGQRRNASVESAEEQNVSLILTGMAILVRLTTAESPEEGLASSCEGELCSGGP